MGGKWITRAIGTVVASYAAAAVLALGLERKMIFPAPRDAIEPDARAGRLLRIESPSGRVVHAIYAPAPPDSPTIVHFHGNGEALDHLVHLSMSFQAAGVGFFAVEYPGYGLSRDGQVSEASIYEDADAALVHLRDALNVPKERIVIEGQSLGTGVAVEMAQRGHGSRLVLISPFTSMVDMVRRLVPVLPASLVVRDRFDSASKVPALSLPALVVHGSLDELIPLAMGRRLAAGLPNCRLIVLEKAHHNDVWSAAPSLPRRIADFARGRL
jgi:pimeloyl-ACP methyl ester carboxylesterase